MNYFPVGKKDKAKVRVGVEEVNLDKIEFWYTRKENVVLPKLPRILTYTPVVVLNDEIYTLGSYIDGSSYWLSCYKWVDHSYWVKISDLPHNLAYGSAVVYNNEIHILGGAGSNRAHYKWDGETWTQVSTLPSEVRSGYRIATVFDGYIYAIFNRKFYKWDGETWTQVTNENSSLYTVEEICAYDDRIFIRCYNYDSSSRYFFYIWDGTTFKYLSAPDQSTYHSLVVAGGKLYCANSNSNTDNPAGLHVYTGSGWSNVGVPCPYSSANGLQAVSEGGRIHLFVWSYSNQAPHYLLAIDQYQLIVNK